jgi:hypothetical protein
MKLSYVKLEEAYQQGCQGQIEPSFLLANEETLEAVADLHASAKLYRTFNAARFRSSPRIHDGWVVFLNPEHLPWITIVDARVKKK